MTTEYQRLDSKFVCESPRHDRGGTRCAMGDEPMWETISNAPYDRDLELAVIEGDHVHPLVFACRRAPSGWVKVTTRERISVSPTHWRLWQVG